MILYHGTNNKRLPSIKQKGLIPTAPKASSGEDYVYLTDKPEIAALFSGHGRDAQGFQREGYMSTMEAKKQNGVVLKVEADPEYLEDDQIWEKKKSEMLDKKKLREKIYQSVKEDYERGNQILDFHVEKELHKLWKESMEDMEDEDKVDFDFFVETSPEYLEAAIDKVVSRETEKELASMLKESERYLSGNLYQYSKEIPPEKILAVFPAKQFLKSDSGPAGHFGSGFEIQTASLIKALKRVVSDKKAEVEKATIPTGSYLFHGTSEDFSGDLKPGGYDGLIWFSDTPKIAQMYIPESGMRTYISAEDLVRPSKDKTDQLIQKTIGIEWDLSEIEWDGNRARSWGAPKGWDKIPKEKDIKDLLDKFGLEGDKSGRYEIKIGRGDKILKPDEAIEGRLFIAKVKEPLTLWRKSKGEGDLMDLQYHDLSGFQAAKAMGLDGVLIDDFVKSKEWGNFGHLSAGLFDAGKLEIRSVPARHREWVYSPKGTPEYPNPPEMFLHKI